MQSLLSRFPSLLPECSEILAAYSRWKVGESEVSFVRFVSKSRRNPFEQEYFAVAFFSITLIYNELLITEDFADACFALHSARDLRCLAFVRGYPIRSIRFCSIVKLPR